MNLQMLRMIRGNRMRCVAAPAEPGSENQGDPESQEPTNIGTDPANGDEPLGDGGMKALRAEREANKQLRAKLEEMSATIKGYEDEHKSAEEKAAEHLKQIEQENTQNAAKALRLEVALDKGLPKQLAARLQGSTREEMEQDADSLLELVNAQSKPRMKPDPSQGMGGAGAKPVSLEDAISHHFAPIRK